eukprot:364397-Chlamydomonas_euryale.AAC.3
MPVNNKPARLRACDRSWGCGGRSRGRGSNAGCLLPGPLALGAYAGVSAAAGTVDGASTPLRSEVLPLPSLPRLAACCGRTSAEDCMLHSVPSTRSGEPAARRLQKLSNVAAAVGTSTTPGTPSSCL